MRVARATIFTVMDLIYLLALPNRTAAIEARAKDVQEAILWPHSGDQWLTCQHVELVSPLPIPTELFTRMLATCKAFRQLDYQENQSSRSPASTVPWVVISVG